MKFLQKIKQAFVSSPGTDGSAYPNGQAKHNSKVTSFNRFLPYGLSSLEPAGAFVLLLSAQDQEAVKFGIPSAMQLRKKSLKEGEVAIFNSITGVWVFIKEDGTVEINADTLIIGDLHVTGDTQIDGDLTVDGDSLVKGNSVVTGNLSTGGTLTATVGATIGGIDFGTHVHGGVESGTHTSGGPQ